MRPRLYINTTRVIARNCSTSSARPIRRPIALDCSRSGYGDSRSSPATIADDFDIAFIRIGRKIVGLSSAYRLRMWMGGVECPGEGRGAFITHPDYRGRNLWRNIGNLKRPFTPVQFGWSRLPPRVGERYGRLSDPVRPLIRILDVGPFFEYFAHSRFLGSIGTAASAAVRVAATPLRRGRGDVMRLDSFDEPRTGSGSGRDVRASRCSSGTIDT